MAIRTLARFYYYIVFIALLSFMTWRLGSLFGTALGFTALRGSAAPPPGTQLTQDVLFAVIAVGVFLTLGGLHYWLARKDIASYPSEGAESGVRSFFLNFSEGIAAIVAVAAGASALWNLGQIYGGYYGSQAYSPDVSGLFGAALASLLMVTLLELERRRALPTRGAAIVLQRWHLYVVLFVILNIAAQYATAALNATLLPILLNSKVVHLCSSGPVYTPDYSCLSADQGVLGPYLAFGWSAAAWVGYLYLSRGDLQSTLRHVWQLLSTAVGAGYVIFGAVSLVALGYNAANGASFNWSAFYYQRMIPTIVVGVIVLVIYLLMMRAEGERSRMGAVTSQLAAQAVLMIALAIPFWVGASQVIYRILDDLATYQRTFGASSWAYPLAELLVGVIYIPLGLVLRAATKRTEVTSPRRAVVLALLAGGVVASAIGFAVALYAYGSSIAGAPISDFERVGRVGISTLIPGLVLAGFYAWSAWSERLLVRAPGSEPSGGAMPATTVEQLLDQVATGAISRAEAAARVREIVRAGG